MCYMFLGFLIPIQIFVCTWFLISRAKDKNKLTNIRYVQIAIFFKFYVDFTNCNGFIVYAYDFAMRMLNEF